MRTLRLQPVRHHSRWWWRWTRKGVVIACQRAGVLIVFRSNERRAWVCLALWPAVIQHLCGSVLGCCCCSGMPQGSCGSLCFSPVGRSCCVTREKWAKVSDNRTWVFIACVFFGTKDNRAGCGTAAPQVSRRALLPQVRCGQMSCQHHVWGHSKA